MKQFELVIIDCKTFHKREGREENGEERRRRREEENEREEEGKE